jgi:uncharacterized membrane protein YjjP (DUF1212 family)
VYLILGAIIVSFSLTIIRDRDIFSNCSAKIEALSVVFLVFRLIFIKAVVRFSAVYLASVKSRV